MKILFISFIIFLTNLTGDESKKAFNKIKRLEGTWQRTLKEGSHYEEWGKINGSWMRGNAYRVLNKDTTVLEQLQLIRENGELLYIATIPNQNDGQSVAFKLTDFTSTTFTFENPAHDFPKRIVYELIQKDSLYIYVDSGAGTKKSEYIFGRKN